ncbi:MAG: hypothetical protein EOO39_24505 [Cytophagaceae bacterium]|nr:MAG: hypothetical protein EOO39_24505 [Cytophagaceae bacterium]
MKSALALFLGVLMLAGSLFPQTDVEEVFKIPGLVSHYQMHKQAAGSDFNFWQFLDLHYNTASTHANTPHQGTQLPMYHHLSVGFVFIISQLNWLPTVSSGLILRLPAQFSYENSYSFQSASWLFQPPRLG